MKVLYGVTVGIVWVCLAATTYAVVLAADEVRLLAHDARVLMRQCVEGIDYDKPIADKEDER